jgi:hypothetical protein
MCHELFVVLSCSWRLRRQHCALQVVVEPLSGSSTRETRERRAIRDLDGQQLVLEVFKQRDAQRSFIIFTCCAAAGAVLARCGGSSPLPFVLEALQPGDTGQTWPGAVTQAPHVVQRSARPYRCML